MSDWHRTVPNLMTGPERAALSEESRRLRVTAQISQRLDYRLVDDVQLLSPARNRYVQAGAVRSTLHARSLGERLSALLGHPVQAELSSYLFYERGDFIGLHVDQRICQLTVLVLLDGDAGPLRVHPELRQLSAQQLLGHGRSHGGHPPGGTAVHLQDGPLLLRGGALPHHRPPHQGDSDITLAAFCYSFPPDPDQCP